MKLAVFALVLGLCLAVNAETHHADSPLDGHTAILAHNHQAEDVKMLNGSVSSRGSSPALEHEEQEQQTPKPQPACIVRTLSIEAASTPSTTANLMTGTLSLSLTNGVGNAAAAAAAAEIK